MGYKKAEKHSLSFAALSSNPLDSTEYRFCSGEALTAPVLANFFQFTKTITITKYTLKLTAAVGGYSDEPWLFYIRNADLGTDIVTGTITKNAVNGYRGAFTVDCDATVPIMNAIQFKTVTPAWATNPTAVKIEGYIEYIEL